MLCVIIVAIVAADIWLSIRTKEPYQSFWREEINKWM